jgi:predicted nucleic acid-binding protein
MPADEYVVSNTSPLLNLALTASLDLLERQFDSLHAPEQVWTELTEGADGIPELRALRDRDVLSIESVDETDLYVEIGQELDDGETAAITHAIQADADLILLDEREGRRVARRHDLRVTGVIGILLRAARTGAIDLRTELDALREEGFWISDELYEEILRRSTEDVE